MDPRPELSTPYWADTCHVEDIEIAEPVIRLDSGSHDPQRNSDDSDHGDLYPCTNLDLRPSKHRHGIGAEGAKQYEQQHRNKNL